MGQTDTQADSVPGLSRGTQAWNTVHCSPLHQMVSYMCVAQPKMFAVAEFDWKQQHTLNCVLEKPL